MSKQTKWLGAAALVASFSLVLTACGGGAEDGNTDNGGGSAEEGQAEGITGADYNPVPREEMQQGGDVTLPIGELTEQMNAMHGDGAVDTQMIWTWYNPQIILSTPEGEAYPNPAYISEKTVETVDGNTVMTLTFTDEAQFNDGTPMDWKTIENTWIANRSQDEYAPNSTEGYRNIASVEAGETDKQAVVTFDGTFAWVDALFFNVTHPAVDSAEKFNTAYVEEPNADWGAGPYKIETMDLDGGVATFVPNEKWWGDEPMLDSVTFRVMEPTAAMNAFRAGEIDQVATGTADRLEQVADMDDVTTYRAARTATNLLELNAEREQFADLETRKAVMMAIDREQITDVVWDGLGYTPHCEAILTIAPDSASMSEGRAARHRRITASTLTPKVTAQSSSSTASRSPTSSGTASATRRSQRARSTSTRSRTATRTHCRPPAGNSTSKRRTPSSTRPAGRWATTRSAPAMVCVSRARCRTSATTRSPRRACASYNSSSSRSASICRSTSAPRTSSPTC